MKIFKNILMIFSIGFIISTITSIPKFEYKLFSVIYSICILLIVWTIYFIIESFFIKKEIRKFIFYNIGNNLYEYPPIQFEYPLSISGLILLNCLINSADLSILKIDKFYIQLNRRFTNITELYYTDKYIIWKLYTIFVYNKYKNMYSVMKGETYE